MSNTGYLRTMSDSNFNKRLLHGSDADVTGCFSYPFIGHSWMWRGPRPRLGRAGTADPRPGPTRGRPRGAPAGPTARPRRLRNIKWGKKQNTVLFQPPSTHPRSHKFFSSPNPCGRSPTGSSSGTHPAQPARGGRAGRAKPQPPPSAPALRACPAGHGVRAAAGPGQQAERRHRSGRDRPGSARPERAG